LPEGAFDDLAVLLRLLKLATDDLYVSADRPFHRVLLEIQDGQRLEDRIDERTALVSGVGTVRHGLREVGARRSDLAPGELATEDVLHAGLPAADLLEEIINVEN